jgi:agmatine/peptidylarginine deiminase
MNNEVKFFVAGALDKVVITSACRRYYYPADPLFYDRVDWYDTDRDCISTHEELNIYGSDPNDPDTDDDGIKDGDDWFTPPEWAPKDELIVTWGGDTGIKTVLKDIVANSVDTVKVKINVNNLSEQQNAIKFLTEARVPLDNVEFFVIDLHAQIFVRDYGPNFVVNPSDEIGVFEWNYRLGGPADDYPYNYTVAYPQEIKYYLGEGNMSFEGGNFQTDGNGYGYTCSDMSPADKSELRARYGLKDVRQLKCDTVFFPPHLDLYVYIASRNTVIVADFPFPNPQNDTYRRDADRIADETARKFEDWGFTVYRVKTPYPLLGGKPAYTNALVLNDRVLFPTYFNTSIPNNVTPEMDDEAFTIFQMAFPGKTIIRIDASYVEFGYLGAIHCLTMTRPALPWR